MLGTDGPEPIGRSGELGAAEYELSRAAASLLAGGTTDDSQLSAMTIEPGPDDLAVLLARDPQLDAGAHESPLGAARTSLSGLLHRRARVVHTIERRSEVAAAQRRLARLQFDLHDGPQQEIHLLARTCACSASSSSRRSPITPTANERSAASTTFEAQLIALDRGLRRLATAGFRDPRRRHGL